MQPMSTYALYPTSGSIFFIELVAHTTVITNNDVIHVTYFAGTQEYSADNFEGSSSVL